LSTCTAVLVVAQPARAVFAVDERGSTVIVSQNDAERLTVVRNPGGDLVVSDGVSIAAYPAAKNLVVRGSRALTPSFVDVVPNAPLPESLTLDLPGASDATVAGPAAVVGGSLTGGAGDDVVNLDGRDLQVARLRLDFGEGTDTHESREFTLPPGSTIEGLP